MKKTATKSSPRPGRPQGSEGDTRAQLIEAARRQFALHGFRGTTVRHIADSAGVTPAMVHYHFGNKHGLYQAMLQETLNPLLSHLQQLATDSDGSLQDAIAGYMRQLIRTPELPALLIRDVLTEGGAMRETFIREFATRGASAMRKILQRDHEAGRLRADIDPRLALLSLMSMTAFPFIARPIASKVLDLTYDEAMVEQLAKHTATLFHRGVCRQESDA